MRKRFFLFLFAAIAGTLTALAEEYIWISGHKMSFDSSWAKDYTYFTDASSGSVKWDASTRTLTLNNFVVDRTYVNYLYSGTKDCIVFYSKRSVTIELQGNNKLYTPYRYTLALQGNTTFTGDGFLCISNGDNKKPCIDMLEEDLTITFDGPRFTLEARNSGIRGKNNTGTLRFKAGEMTVKPLNMLSNNRIVSDLGNIVFDYGMGIKMYGVYYNKAKHCMMGSKDEELIGGCVDFGPIEYYGFAICGTWITKYNCDNIEKFVTSIRSGSVKYDPDENYLRLDNVTLLNGTTAPTILNENNKYLHIGFRGKNTFQFEGERGRWAMNLKENTDISGGQLDVIGADYAGIHVGSDKSLYLKNVTLNIPFMKGGNLNSRLYLESGVEINATGNTDIGTLGWLQVQEYGDQHDVAVESNMSQPRFIWKRKDNKPSGVYENQNNFAKGEVHLSTKDNVDWYNLYICGYQANSLNRLNPVNEYFKSGSLSYDAINALTMTNVSIDYDNQEASKAAIQWEGSDRNSIFYLMLNGNNTIKNSNHPEAIRSKGNLQIRRSESDEATLTLTGTNANVYANNLLGLVDVTAKMSSVTAEGLGIMSSNLSITQKLEVESCELTDVKVASTPEAPAYYDSESKKLVAPKGPVNIVRSGDVTVYDGIKFFGEEVNSANASCLLNKYFTQGSLSVKKTSGAYDITMDGIGVLYDGESPMFHFTSTDRIDISIKNWNFFNFTNAGPQAHFIRGDSKSINIYDDSKNENILGVTGSATTNAGAIQVGENSSLWLRSRFVDMGGSFNAVFPRIYGMGSTSKLTIMDPYVTVFGNSQGSVANIKCELGENAELYNTETSALVIKDNGIYKNGSLYQGIVKFVGKGESYVPVTYIRITVGNLTFTNKGESLTLSATVLPTNATNKKVSWTIRDNSIASVDQNGKVTALRRGTTYVYAVPAGAFDDSIVDSLKVTVDIPQPTSITLDQTDVLIDRESTGGIYLTASLTPSNAETDFEWESSDPTLVSVLRTSGQTALVRRVGDEGTATITVKTANGLSASCKVTVHYPITPELVEFNPRTYTLTEEGQQIKLVPIVKPANCEKLSFTWYTYGEAISLSDDGTVTALRNGSAVVECWACYDGQKWAPGEVRINVEIPPTPVIATGLTISPSSVAIFYSLGESVWLKPVFTPENVTNDAVVWATTDASVATVDENGLLTVVGWGDCDITATTTDGSGITARRWIQAIDPSTLPEPVYATGIRLSDNEVTLMRGEEARIGLTVEPADYTESIMIEPLEGDVSIAQVNAEWDWNTNQNSIYIRSEEWSEMSGDMKWVVRPSVVDWEKLNAMGIWEEPRDTLTIHVLSPIIFAEASPEDINITYHVTDINENTCEVYTQGRPGMSTYDPLDSELIPAVATTSTGKLTIPSRVDGYWVTHVMPCAFNRCSGLTEIDFSEGITSIGDYACYTKLYSLERVTLPSTIEELGSYCFSANFSDYDMPILHTNLREVNIKAFTPPTGQNGSNISMTGAFQSVAADAVLFVPTGALANYNVEPWTQWFSRIEEKAFFEDEDAIASPKSSPEGKDFNWFDLSGRKLGNKPAKPGLYIQNGKKVVVK